jgi:hypothetical protein
LAFFFSFFFSFFLSFLNFMMQGIVMVDSDEKTLCTELAVYIARLKLEKKGGMEEAMIAEAIIHDDYVKKCQSMEALTDEFFMDFVRYATSQGLGMVSIYTFLLAILILYTKKNDEKLTSLMRFMISILLRSSNEEAWDPQLRMLEHMFNCLPTHHHLRYELFVQMIQLAFRLGVENGFLSLLQKVPEWHTTTKEECALYELVRNGFQQSGNMELAVEYAIRAMTCVTSKEDFPSYKNETKLWIVEALRLPQLFLVDRLLEIPLVQSIKGDPVYDMGYFTKI